MALHGQGMRTVSCKRAKHARQVNHCALAHALTPSLVQETFEFYLKATGHGTEAKALAAHDKFGLNKVDVPIPAFASLLKDHLLAPFFVFQV